MTSITFLLGASADSQFKMTYVADFLLSAIGEDSLLSSYEKSIEKFYREIKNDWYPSFVNSICDKNDLLKESTNKRMLST